MLNIQKFFFFFFRSVIRSHENAYTHQLGMKKIAKEKIIESKAKEMQKKRQHERKLSLCFVKFMIPLGPKSYVKILVNRGVCVKVKNHSSLSESCDSEAIRYLSEVST